MEYISVSISSVAGFCCGRCRPTGGDPTSCVHLRCRSGSLCQCRWRCVGKEAGPPGLQIRGTWPSWWMLTSSSATSCARAGEGKAADASLLQAINTTAAPARPLMKLSDDRGGEETSCLTFPIEAIFLFSILFEFQLNFGSMILCGLRYK